jgi:hypothetical protein
MGQSRNPPPLSPRRRRWIIICSVVAAALVVAIAVVVFVMRKSLFHETSKSKTQSDLNDDANNTSKPTTNGVASLYSGMWFPQTLDGTGLNGRMSASARVNQTYDQLLA